MRIEERVVRITPEQARRRRRATLQVLWVCALALVPWTIYLGLSLPNVYSTQHWAAAWTGFDVLELFALAATAYYAWRGRQALIAYAIAAATLLICDAWFDVMLDLGTSGIWTSLASAVFIELPLAFFLLQRATLLMRLIMLHFFPEGHVDGKPIRLTKLPLLTMLPFAAELAVEAVQEEVEAAIDSLDSTMDREPGSSDAR
jgi:hypothetical protein